MVSIYEDDTGVVFDKEVVSDDDIPRICERTTLPRAGAKWSLQLLLTCEEDLDILGYPIPYSLKAVIALWSHWHIPYNHIPSYFSNDNVTMQFSPVLGESTWRGFSSDSDQFASVVVYNTLTRQTFGVCVMPTGDYLDRLTERIESCKTFASDPFFVPVSWTSLVIDHLGKECDELSLSCPQVANMIGYLSEDEEQDSDRLPNVTQVPRRLNNIATRYGVLDYRRLITGEHLDQLDKQLRNSPNEYSPVVRAELQEQTFYLLQCTKNIDFNSRYGKELIQSMVQTVYATLQQRDNQLNHRYGADMRLITAITLIFLPGTFVATFFSTTFWNFSPDNRGAKVTYWVYLYFVVTLGLTLIVLVVWRKFSAFKRLVAKMMKIVSRIPLLGRMMKKKRMNDEEQGRKGD
ncbi:hypothetical protein ACET3X_001644 [Alternaria dauci]|uniref:Uncharacterized protein n=1 Tax=Alternaria dauci TaxID=48095 RepID=A0ABR3UYA0_9PLEO